MKYKILKGTKLFKKFVELHTKMKRCNRAASDLVGDVGYGTKWYKPTGGIIAGGLEAFVITTGKPDGWASAYKPHVRDAYMPNRRLKANADLIKRIDELPVVSTDEFNILIGYNWKKACGSNKGMGRRTISYSPGFSVHDDYVLIDVSEHAPHYKPVEDMVEITVSEYNKLKA